MGKGKAKVTVEVRKGDINKALKIFKRKGFDSGHIQELKDRKQFIKPTTMNRREKQRAIYIQKLRTDEEMDSLGSTKSKPTKNVKK